MRKQTLRGQASGLTSYAGECRAWCDIRAPRLQNLLPYRPQETQRVETTCPTLGRLNPRWQELRSSQETSCFYVPGERCLGILPWCSTPPSSLHHTALPTTWALPFNLSCFPIFVGFAYLFFAFVFPTADFIEESWRHPAGGKYQTPILYFLSTPIQLPDSWLPLEVYYSLWDWYTGEGSAEETRPRSCQARRNNIISLWEQFILVVFWFKLTRRNGQLWSNFPNVLF